MSRPPSSIMTFLFTDIQGSNKLWEQDHDAIDEAIKHHDTLFIKMPLSRANYCQWIRPLIWP